MRISTLYSRQGSQKGKQIQRFSITSFRRSIQQPEYRTYARPFLENADNAIILHLLWATKAVISHRLGKTFLPSPRAHERLIFAAGAFLPPMQSLSRHTIPYRGWIVLGGLFTCSLDAIPGT